MTRPQTLPRCACGAEAIAISPGRAPVVDNLFEFDGGEPSLGWCAACWVPPWPGERRSARRLAEDAACGS